MKEVTLPPRQRKPSSRKAASLPPSAPSSAATSEDDGQRVHPHNTRGAGGRRGSASAAVESDYSDSETEYNMAAVASGPSERGSPGSPGEGAVYHGVDFTKLSERSLWNYVGQYDLSVPPSDSITVQQLASMCQQHFITWKVEENSVLQSLCGPYEERLLGTAGSGPCASVGGHKRPYIQSREFMAPGPFPKRTLGGGGERRNAPERGGILPKGEKVASMVAGTADENGSWILSTVMKYFEALDKYEILDDDDSERRIVVEACHVMRLSDDTTEGFLKGAQVLAMFPATTSFYRANVAKGVRRGATEVLVQFEDDEDQLGKTPTRKLQSRYVMKMPDVRML